METHKADVVIIGFVAASSTSITVLYNVGTLLQALLEHMHAEAAAGRALAWSPIVRGAPNDFIMGYVSLFMMTAATAGAIYFFFECRARNRKVETVESVAVPGQHAVAQPMTP